MDFSHPDPGSDVEARLAALASYEILDTDPEAGFDDIVLLASRLCAAPIALVSLLTQDRQWFKACVGLAIRETPMSDSVCAHALTQPGLLVIPDLATDPRTRDNRLVTGEPHIRFYAGATLATPEGVAIGTLCVLDIAPRPDGLHADQCDALAALARQVVAQLELRRAVRARDHAIAAQQRADQAFRQSQAMLTSELQHRLKNQLAVVQAILLQTLREGVPMKACRDASLARVAALARCQELLFLDEAESTSLEQLLRTTTHPLETIPGRFRLVGPAIDVAGKTAVSFALLFHELATNATKYGALSTDAGYVSITWRLLGGTAGPSLSIRWQEHGGPAVTPPAQIGFGTRLIRQIVIGATVDLRHAAHGVICDVEIPVGRLRQR